MQREDSKESLQGVGDNLAESGFLISESSEGGDELLRIIRGFGNDFEPTPGVPEVSTSGDNEMEMEGYPSCCIPKRAEGPRAECWVLVALGCLDTLWAQHLWVLHLIGLVLLCAYVPVSDVAAAVLATFLMMAFYLPLRRGLPAALRTACAKATAENNPNDRDDWLRGALVLLFPTLLSVSLIWLLAVGELAHGISTRDRPVEKVTRFAGLSVLWVWPEAILDVLRVYLQSKRAIRISLVDVLLGCIVMPPMTVALLNHGMGVIALPLAKAASHALRLIVLVTAAGVSGQLPPMCSTTRWHLLPSAPRPRRIPTRRGNIQGGPSNDDSSSPALQGVPHAMVLLGKQTLITGFLRSWRADAPLLIVGVLAWSLGNASMVAHGILLAVTMILITVSGHPGLARAAEARIRQYMLRNQPSAARAVHWVAMSSAAIVAAVVSLVSALVVSVSVDESGTSDGSAAWAAAAGSVWAAAGYTFCSSVISILRAFLKATEQETFAAAAFHGFAALSVVLSYAFSQGVSWGLAGIWLGMFIGSVLGFVACATKCFMTMAEMQD
uniref:Protein RFT1 homolog n=1 Tax=Lotharella globosa TaxID=91324 RepID=A0A7S3Z9G9_9EUKA|mmetsp:Transcript_29579/g.57182  ORF Transcript_29579/g.57182 Transcript_29579/m.57182 type:complete len:554 (+) Transcript_29579:68-1729(+)